MSMPTEIMFVARKRRVVPDRDRIVHIAEGGRGCRCGSRYVSSIPVDAGTPATVRQDPDAIVHVVLTCIRAPPSTRRLLKYPTSVQ